MTDPLPTKPDYQHLQISLRLPHWVVARIDDIAAAEFSNRASVLRRLLAGSVRNASTPPCCETPKSFERDHPRPTESHPEPTPLLHHPHRSQA